MIDHSPLDRRQLLRGAAAGTLLAMAPWASARSPLVVPVVDRLVLTSIVDNSTFGPFLSDETRPGLKIVRTMASGPRMSRKALMAEFGLSILAESQRGGDVRRFLIDFGYTPEVLSNNLSQLGIDPNQIDSSVLSHGHLDHYGGFSGLFAQAKGAGHSLPLIVGGEETFCERVAMIGSPPPVMGLLSRTELRQAGFVVRVKQAPAILENHGFTTGHIPLETFERAAIPTQMRPGVGCDAAALSPSKRSLVQLADDGEHELATCFAIKDLGLVVIASCSHRGVLNSVRRAQAVSGIDKVHAVVGGYHLVRPRTEDEARRTVAEFVQLDPTYIIPMHCTGETFIAEAMRRVPNKVIRPYVGNRFIFGA